MTPRRAAHRGAVRGLAVVVCVSVGALAACEPHSPIDDFGSPLAWVGEQKLILADLRASEPLTEEAARRAAIDRGIDDLLIAREARRRGLGYTEQAARRIAAVRRAAEIRERRILRNALFDVVASEVEVDESELRAEFERIDGSVQRRRVTLRVQTFSARDQAERALRAPAPEVPLLGPLLARELPRATRRALKQIESVGGGVVVPVGDQWSAVELVAVEAAGDPTTFERAREALTERVRRRKADAAFEREIERLRADAEIRIEPGAIENEALWIAPIDADNPEPPDPDD